jgi:hypothetical protein
LLREQIQDFDESNYTITKDIYLLCPGTKIELGGGYQSTGNSNAFVDLGGKSDFPLWVFGPNTTISCGFHGSDDSINEYDENPCILNGGTQQGERLILYRHCNMDVIRSDFLCIPCLRSFVINQRNIPISVLVYFSAQYEFSINKAYWYEVAGPKIDPSMTTDEWEKFAQASSNLRLDNVTIRG